MPRCHQGRAGHRGRARRVPERRASTRPFPGGPRRPHGRVRSRGRLGGAGLRPGDAGAAGAPPREALPVLPGCPGCEGASRWGRLRPVARELRRLPVQPGSLRVRPARLPPRAPMRRGPRIAARGCLALARAERPGMGGRAGRRSARSVKICPDGQGPGIALAQDRGGGRAGQRGSRVGGQGVVGEHDRGERRAARAYKRPHSLRGGA